MKELIEIILKKGLSLLIVVTALLPLLTTIFNFIATVFVAIPVFASTYVKVGFGVFIFKIVQGFLKNE